MAEAITSAPPRLKLYSFPKSGHAHKTALFLSLIGLSAEIVNLDLSKGEHKQPDFLMLNALGQVPVLVDGDEVIADSNAILVYLALKYAPESWLPRDPLVIAKVQRFLSIAAGEVFRGPASARAAALFNAPLDTAAAQAVATRLFTMLEAHLTASRYLAADHATIADIACYSYIAHAPEGGVSLQPYPQLRQWLERIQALPGFVAMPASPLPLAA